MSAADRTFEHVRDVILSAHESASTAEKIDFYDNWAESYEQDVAVLQYRAPALAAGSVCRHYTGAREAALVLDVACGTGLVAAQMKKDGFAHFVGIDGSGSMLELARKSGLYQDVRQCILGDEDLPVQWGSFDVVLLVGALSCGQVPVAVVTELCRAAKPGGVVCMTTRSNLQNLEYKADLERELRRMEEDGRWCRVEVQEEEEWERAVSREEEGFIGGSVYLYRTAATEKLNPKL